MSRFFRKADDSDSDTESSSEEELMSSDDEAPKAAASTAKPAKSRFLRTSDDDSESESESDSESDEESMSEEEGKGKKKSRFLRTEDSDEDSDEDEGKRVVKSARDKRLEEMEASGKQMDNALKINDWVAISNGMFAYPLSVSSAVSSWAQNSISSYGWYNGSRTFQSQSHHFIFANYRTLRPRSLRLLQRRRKPKRR